MKYLALPLLFLVPSLSFAHTKWFAETDLLPYVTKEPVSIYLSTLLLISLIVVAASVLLERKNWLRFSQLKPQRPHVFERAASTFVMVSGAFFLIAGTHEYLFSPNQTVASGIPMFLIAVQIIIGLAFLLGIASRVSGIILGILWGVSFHYVGVIAALENIWVLSTAIFITFMGNEYFSVISFSALRSLVAPFKQYALSTLRIGTGISLMVLGLSEKILAPEFGVNFLSLHHWNFMSALGFNYSDYLFTLTAGTVEFLFGLIFVLGIITRLNAFFVTIVFSIPLFLLGPVELAGHLPHFAAIILLLLFGNGGHFTFFKERELRNKTNVK